MERHLRLSSSGGERQRILTNEDQRRLITMEQLKMTHPGMERQKKAPEKPEKPEKPKRKAEKPIPKAPGRPKEPEKPMPIPKAPRRLKEQENLPEEPVLLIPVLKAPGRPKEQENLPEEPEKPMPVLKAPEKQISFGLDRKQCAMEPEIINEDEEDVDMELLEETIDEDEESSEAESSEVNWSAYWLLCKKIQDNDWKGVENFVRDHPEALTVDISDSKTIFHHIVYFVRGDIKGAISLIETLLALKVDPKILEKKDSRGFTVLHLSAIRGNTEASKILVECNSNLPNVWSENGWIPVQHAAFYGHERTVKYLESVTAQENLVGINGALLISHLINSNLHDIALDFLKKDPPMGRDQIGSRKIVFKTLAGKPSAFESGTRLGRLQSFIYNWIPVKKEKVSSIDQTNKNRSADVDLEDGMSKNYYTSSTFFGAMCQDLLMMFWNVLSFLSPSIKAIREQKLMHLKSVEILKMICDGVAWNDPEIFKGNDKDRLFLHTAARFGISEFFNEIIKTYNDSLYQTNSEGHHIFHLAVLHRHEEVFKLIDDFSYLNDMLNVYDKSGNNMLHLAGRLVPSSKVSGAALQTQRESQWFKAVEDLLPQCLQEEKNEEEKTPRELFAESHKELVKEGEKWMKDTAQSCTIAATLIITVVFAAAFTVPGGNNDRGQPIFLKEKPFLIFAISDALAFFSSTTSLLMFLGILTSRYSANDFLVSLPRKLIIGLITLFFSIASMTVAFGATIYVVLSQPLKWVIIPIALLGCVPVTLFARLQFPLLLDMILSTYVSSILHRVK